MTEQVQRQHQLADRLMIGIKIVELPGISGDSGAAVHPEIQKVAAHRKRRAVARDCPVRSMVNA